MLCEGFIVQNYIVGAIKRIGGKVCMQKVHALSSDLISEHSIQDHANIRHWKNKVQDILAVKKFFYENLLN